MVAHTGFEPVISSLRGRCPKPLDECARIRKQVKSSQKFTKQLLEKFIISLSVIISDLIIPTWTQKDNSTVKRGSREIRYRVNYFEDNYRLHKKSLKLS